MSFKTNDCQQLSLDDSFMTPLSRFRKRCYDYETLHDVDLYHDCVKYIVCSKCNIPMNYLGEIVQQDWTLVKTEACPNNSVGGGDPAKYHYTYIRRVAYRYACTKCGYTYKQIATETKYVNTCNEH